MQVAEGTARTAWGAHRGLCFWARAVLLEEGAHGPLAMDNPPPKALGGYGGVWGPSCGWRGKERSPLPQGDTQPLGDTSTLLQEMSHLHTHRHTRAHRHTHALQSVVLPRKQTFSGQSPHGPRPPTFPPLPVLIYRSQDGSPQSVKKPRLPACPHRLRFLARKVQVGVRCLPFPL